MDFEETELGRIHQRCICSIQQQRVWRSQRLLCIAGDALQPDWAVSGLCGCAATLEWRSVCRGGGSISLAFPVQQQCFRGSFALGYAGGGLCPLGAASLAQRRMEGAKMWYVCKHRSNGGSAVNVSTMLIAAGVLQVS
eukprot:364803-Chlamydomonas_euryale.AAC.5